MAEKKSADGVDGKERPSKRPKVKLDPDDLDVTSVEQISVFATTNVALVRDRAMLTVVSGPQMGFLFPLSGPRTTLGRGTECDLRIDDNGVSRKHACIVRQGVGDYVIEDLGSSNGTAVNGSLIKRQRLVDGDRIQLGGAAVLRFALTDQAEEERLRRMYDAMVRDELTGAFNRKYLSERLVAEVAFAQRSKTPLVVMMIDLDHFKAVNDTYGHPAGDLVLRRVAGAIRGMLRAEDVFARYGGEEFMVVARNVDVTRAMTLAERIRVTVQATGVAYDEHLIQITASIGVASLACAPEGAGYNELIHVADQRLYQAKTEGRNRCVGA